MKTKLLICGVLVILGLGLVVHRQASARSKAALGLSTTSERSLRGHGPAYDPKELPGRIGNSRSPVEDRWSVLIERLANAVRTDEPFDREGFSAMIGKLTEADCDAAARFVESLPSGPMREDALRQIAKTWARIDSGSAEMWASKLADENERVCALGHVCFQIAETDPLQGLMVANQHSLDENSGEMPAKLAQLWAAEDFNAAATWVKERPLGDQRDQMLLRLAVVLSATDPEQSARLVVAEIPEGPLQDEAVLSVVYQWAKRDIVATRNWVQLFPEGRLRDRVEADLLNMAAYGVALEQ